MERILLLAVGAVALALFSLSVPVEAGEPSGVLAGFAQQRTWSDQSGRFKIPATLAYADRKEARLRKADGLLVTVPLDKLSTADQRFIESFLTAETALGASNPSGSDDAENPFAGGVAAPAPMNRSVTRADSAATPQSPATPGSLEVRQPIVQGFRPLAITPAEAFWSARPPVPFPAIELEDVVLQTPLPKPFFAALRVMAGGKSGTIVLNSYQTSRGNDASFGNFVLIEPISADISQVYGFDKPWKAMALSPDASRLAAVRVEGFDKGNDVAIFRISNGQLIPEFEFKAGGGSWDELHWVAFLPGDRLATISQKHDLTFWDLSNPAGPKAALRGNSGGTLNAAISAAGELIALPIGTSIAVIETAAGKLVGCIQRDQAANRIAFSPDGKSIAAYHPFTITLYSTENGEVIRTVAVAEGNAQAPMQWVGQHLLVNQVLYDVERGLPLWTYESRATQTTLSDYLVSAFGEDKASSVSVLRLPHPVPLRMAADLQPDQIYAVTPGSSVQVRYTLNEASSDVQQAIRAAVESNLKRIGWNIASAASHTVEVTLEQGEQQEAEYFTRRGFGPIFAPPGFRPAGPSEKVKYRPWTHTFKIKSGADDLFTSQFVRGAPQSIQTKEGESTQALVTRMCQPHPQYFQDLKIPPHVLKKEYQGGLGRSKIERTGLQ